ncbi:MAG: transglycosylase domain-containing protein [Rhodothermales bacterium]
MSSRSSSRSSSASARLRAAGRWAATPFRRYAAVVRDPEQPWPKRIAVGLGGPIALGLAFVLALVVYALFLIPSTPSTAELRRVAEVRPSIVVSADGEELAQFERSNREWLPLDSISTHVIDALIATEDRRFYDHGGIDVQRLATATVRTVTGDRQGGSTITQQLARNLYPDEVGRSFTVNRKLREIITALKIERQYEKADILEAYLNTVPFLYNARGVEMAARTYYGKRAYDLSVLEAATLVGMLKGTSYYNPVRNPERAVERRNVVLGQMVKAGALTDAARDSLKTQPLGLDFERQSGPDSRAPHFTRYVREWLTSWADERGYNLFEDGLVIHTTLDFRLQRMAESAVRAQAEGLQAVADVEWSRASMPSLGGGLSAYEGYRAGITPFDYFWRSKPKLVTRFVRSTGRFEQLVAGGASEAAALDSLRADAAFMDSLRTVKTRLEAGFVAVEPGTGYLRAWVGSRDFDVVAYDHVYQARRQPGSTFKPFVYAAALERGWLPGDTFPDEAVAIPIDNGRQTWRPANAGGYSGRDLTLTEGLVQSKNTITAQLMMEVGPANVVSLARHLGVRESPLDPVPALALGTSDVTLLEMATAYATLANGGGYREPIPVTRVETASGRILAEFGGASERAIPRDVAQTVVHMMRGVIDQGTGRRIRSQFGITADVAGKTGTTQNGADGWFLLMHPTLVAGAWVGFEEPAVAFRSDWWGQGAHNALLVVGDFFRAAEPTLPDVEFDTPFRYREPGSIFARTDRYDPEDDAWADSFATADTSRYSYESPYGSDSLYSDYDDFDSDFDGTDEGDIETDEGDDAEEAAADDEAPKTAVQRLYDRLDEEPPPAVGQGAPDPEPQADSSAVNGDE